MCNFQAVGHLFQKLTATLDPSVWRKRARVVAYLEILYHIITVLAAIVYFTFVAVAAHQLSANEAALQSNATSEANKLAALKLAICSEDSTMKLLGMLCLVFGAMACMEVWATVMLIKATKVGADPKFALERARIWRYITIVITILSAILSGYSESLVLDAVQLLVQVCFIGIVSMFIAELRKTIQAANQAGDDFVQVA